MMIYTLNPGKIQAGTDNRKCERTAMVQINVAGTNVWQSNLHRLLPITHLDIRTATTVEKELVY